MKEALVDPQINVRVVTAPSPRPGPKEVLIRVVCAGCNPKDWKWPNYGQVTANSGDDIAGVVEEVGSDVVEFRPGDRVAAFHKMFTPGGAFAEYAVASATTTFHLPKTVTFEEAATIPLATLTAAIALFYNLGLPLPWTGSSVRTPLLIYGGSSAIGAFAIKLATISNIHPLIVVAGKSKAFVKSMLDEAKGDAVVDYTQGLESTIVGIQQALRRADAGPIMHAFDTISEKDSLHILSQVLDPGAHATFVLPEGDYKSIPASIKTSLTYVGVAHDGSFDVGDGTGIRYISPSDGIQFGLVFSRLISHWISEGRFSGHPYQLISGGLDGLQEALQNLQAGKASGTKYVIRVGEDD